jgi:ammonium transporter, Amt family
VYVFAGAMAFVLTRKVGVRPGMYRPHARIGDFRSYNLGITTTGVILIMAGLPMVILSCGFFFEPEALFVSVNMADTSVGVAFNNLGLAWAGGALMGALIAYRTKNYIYTLLGPFAGYVSGAPGFDVYAPWQMFLVAFFAPLVAYVVYEWTQRKEIDEHKLINLFLGVGSYGILMVGLVQWGTKQSGYFGVEEGDYAFQHATMNVGWQALGLAVCIVVGLATAWVLAAILERTIGLRADEEAIVEGFDLHDWDIVHDAPGPIPPNGQVSRPETVAAVGPPDDAV